MDLRRFISLSIAPYTAIGSNWLNLIQKMTLNNRRL